MNAEPTDRGQELPEGCRLQEFVIERTLGVGGFGITYLAHDTSLGRKVVVKEHLPDAFCFRDVAAMTVRPRHSSGEMLENYQWSLGSFLREAEMLAALEHPNIVRVLRRLEDNGTAYFVMPFVEGQSFDKVIDERRNNGGNFSEVELRVLLEELLEAFIYLHGQGVHHRDVKPGNILLTANGRPVLIDFGAARQHFGQKSMTVIESAGYTPFEQTESRGNVGPWSDLYALGGVLRKAITYQTPARSADRIRRDPMTPLVGDPDWQSRFSAVFLESVDRALRVDEEARWQKAEDWLDALRRQEATPVGGTPSGHQPPSDAGISAPPPTDVTTSPVTAKPKSLLLPVAGGRPVQVPSPGKPKRQKNNSLTVGVLVGMIVAGAAGFTAWQYYENGSSTATAASVSESISTTGSTPGTAKPTTPETAVPEAPQWEKLANEGDTFAQALLGEALITGMSGFEKDAERGLEWLVKSSEKDHPLGLFLLAEQKLLEKEAIGRRSMVEPDLEQEQVMFRKAFGLGLEKGVEQGGMVWGAALGRAYERGLGTSPDAAKAIRWLSLAAQAGHPWAECLLGEMCEAGRGIKPDTGVAIRWYGKAAAAAWPPAQAALARLLSNGPDQMRDQSAALDWARKAANSGNSEGMRILGQLLETGPEGVADLGGAFHWYGKAAENGDFIAKGHMGRMYLEGRGIAPDEKEALRLLTEAVDRGDKTSCFSLGSIHENGKSVPQDMTEAVRLYKVGAEAGDPKSQHALALCTERGSGTDADPEAAALLYEKAAAAGVEESGFRLGLLYMAGKGVRQNQKKAAELFQAAADTGLTDAMFEWARCLEKGIGVAKDEKTAFVTYEAAAKEGSSEAAFRSGLMLEEGRGTTKNESLALPRYKTAAEAGIVGAQVNLGILYAQGRGTGKDDEEAVEWYRKAAATDDVDALMLLGMMCEFGHGTKRDAREASGFYRKAAAQGDAEAVKLLKNLTP